MTRANTHYQYWTRTLDEQESLVQAAYPDWSLHWIERGQIRETPEMRSLGTLTDLQLYLHKVGWEKVQILDAQTLEITLTSAADLEKSNLNQLAYLASGVHLKTYHNSRVVKITRSKSAISFGIILEKLLGNFDQRIFMWVASGFDLAGLNDYIKQLTSTVEEQIGGTIDAFLLIAESGAAKRNYATKK
jgi:hypothetical protein